MTIANILTYIDRSMGRFMIQIIDQPILGANKGNFVTMAFNDERLNQIADIRVISIGAYNNLVVLYV